MTSGERKKLLSNEIDPSRQAYYPSNDDDAEPMLVTFSAKL